MNILLTGGSSGLGEAITRKLASDQTSKIFFTYNRSMESATKLEKAFSNVTALKCDFAVPSHVANLAAQVQEFDIDALINNAHTGFERKYFHKYDPKEFLESFTRNILPVVAITSAAIHHFRKKRFGKIVTILSASLVNKPPIGWSEYTAAKAYLLSLSKSWATENSSFNITSNCISPAFMATPLNESVDDRVVEEMIAKHPLKTLLKVEETAETVAFFLKASQQINGTNLIINAAQDVI